MNTSTHHAVNRSGATSVEAIVRQYAAAATQTDDPHLRARAAFALGVNKYEDQHHLLRPTNRNASEAGEQALAIARLPHINEFIYTADADNLRRIIDGMMAGVQRYVPRHDSQHQPGTDDLIEPTHEYACDQINAVRLYELEQIQARLIELVFQEVIDDLNQTDDPVLRREAAFHVGTLKIINERDLRLFDYTSRLQRRMVHDTRDELRIIDRIIADADAVQLREIIAGITSRINIYED